MKTGNQISASRTVGRDHGWRLEHLYNRLIEVAHAGKTVTIDEVARIFCPETPFPDNRIEVTRELCEISCQENGQGRPMLSAVVVLSEIPYPNREFFLLARELGLNMYNDERSFYGYELGRVHHYWKDKIPVRQTAYFHLHQDREVNVPG